MNDPKPAQNRTESDERPESGLPAVQGAREARYAEAMRRSPNGPWMTLPGPTDIAPSFVRAVLPLVDAEVAAAVSGAQAEIKRLTSGAHNCLSTKIEAERADSAEAEVERLRGGIRALADVAQKVPQDWSADSRDAAVDDLLAAVRALSPSPAATTGEAGQSLYLGIGIDKARCAACAAYPDLPCAVHRPAPVVTHSAEGSEP